jgi:hypothetical protein
MTPPPPGPASAAGSGYQDHSHGEDTSQVRTDRSWRDPDGADGGVLGARPRHEQTFHGRDPELAAASEWTDSLRDLVNSILETNLVIQSNRLNVITKKVTGWAAIIAVPTLITGYFGMNVPYPGFSQRAGFVASIATIVLAGLVLYLIFKRKDWL